VSYPTKIAPTVIGISSPAEPTIVAVETSPEAVAHHCSEDDVGEDDIY
jgi:hypothetical protein